MQKLKTILSIVSFSFFFIVLIANLGLSGKFDIVTEVDGVILNYDTIGARNQYLYRIKDGPLITVRQKIQFKDQ